MRTSSTISRRAAVAAVSFVTMLGSASATDYHFKGTADALLDKGANWEPAIDDFTALSASDSLTIGSTDSTVKTLQLSADFAPPVSRWEVGSYTFDLGDHTLTSDAFFVTAYQRFRLTSGTLALLNAPFTIGRHAPNAATAEVTGPSTTLRCKGVSLNGNGIASWGELAIPRFLVRDNAVVNCGGGTFNILGSNSFVAVESAVLTNFTSFVVCGGQGQGFVTKNGDWLFSNSVVQATSKLISTDSKNFSENRIRFCDGTKLTAPSIGLPYGTSNRVEFTGAGTVATHTYANYNGFARFGGLANVIEVSDGAVFQTTGRNTVYSSVSVGFDSDYNGGGRGVEFRVTSGGQLLVPDANINIGEGKINRENRLLAMGAGTYVMSGTGLAIGGSYNNTIVNAYATIFSNVLEIADGAVVSNLANHVELPRQGWGNRTLVNGGALYSAGDVRMGSGEAKWDATNNLVQITGGGRIEAGYDLLVNGASNIVRVVDGSLTAMHSVYFNNGTEGGRLEIGTNGVVKTGSVNLLTATSELVFDLPPSGPKEAPIQGSLNLASGVIVKFKKLSRLSPGDYVVAETEPFGYMWIGEKDDLLPTLNAQLAAARWGTTLKKVGTNWTKGESVKLVLHIAPGAVMMIR